MSSRRNLILLVALTALALPGLALASQQEQAVETVTAEVFKKIGNSVIIRNEAGELKMYHAIPEGVKLFVDGQPAELSDLREGMTLRAIRFENAPEPISVSLEDAGRIATEDDAAAVAAAAAGGTAGAAVADSGAAAGDSAGAAADSAPVPLAATPDAGGGGGGLSFPIIALLAVIVLVGIIIVVIRRG